MREGSFLWHKRKKRKEKKKDGSSDEIDEGGKRTNFSADGREKETPPSISEGKGWALLFFSVEGEKKKKKWGQRTPSTTAKSKGRGEKPSTRFFKSTQFLGGKGGEGGKKRISINLQEQKGNLWGEKKTKGVFLPSTEKRKKKGERRRGRL